VAVRVLLDGPVLRTADRSGTQVVLDVHMLLDRRLTDVHVALGVVSAAVGTAHGMITHFFTSLMVSAGRTCDQRPGIGGCGYGPGPGGTGRPGGGGPGGPGCGCGAMCFTSLMYISGLISDQ